jgi:eukaryotic-like serine/threonine-protein kinase
MGEVYRAHDSRLDRDVALKILPPEVAADESRRRRFEFEARSASALNHPNIVAIYDIGSEGDLFYIVSELVNGESPRTSLEHGPLPIPRVSDIGAQVADGLAASHSAGILHRDLKPENVMLTKDGRAKILDFGLAKQVSSAAGRRRPCGRHHCSRAPRRHPGLHVARADHTATGRCPFRHIQLRMRALRNGDRPASIHRRHIRRDHALNRNGRGGTPLSSAERVLSPAFERIVHRCLEKAPSRRFQTAADLAFALQSFTDTSSSGLRPQLPAPAAPRRNLIWSIAAIAVILASAAYFISPRLGKSAPPVFKRLTFRLGWISSVVMSPDGRMFVYQARWEDTPTRFCLLTVGQPEARDIDLGPAVKLFALSSRGDLASGMGPDGHTLARVPVSGGPARDPQRRSRGRLAARQ